MFFFTKTPAFIRKWYSRYTWKRESSERVIYITFDDGPHPEITPWILNEFKKYNALGTFFCLGKHIEQHRIIFERIKNEGHSIGNHGYAHLNGWKTSKEEYINDFKIGQKLSDSKIFRPPYGKIKRKQANFILGEDNHIVLWDIMPGDWMKEISSEKVLDNIISNIENGSIIVLHDNEKAEKHLKNILPLLLEKLSQEGYQLKGL